MSISQALDAFPVQTETLDAKSFLDVAEKRPQQIKRVTVIPPKLGSKGFGSFQVEYVYPIYKTSHGK